MVRDSGVLDEHAAAKNGQSNNCKALMDTIMRTLTSRGTQADRDLETPN